MEIFFTLSIISSLLLGIYGKKFLNVLFCIFVFIISLAIFTMTGSDTLFALFFSTLITLVVFMLRVVMNILLMIVTSSLFSFLTINLIFSDTLAENIKVMLIIGTAILFFVILFEIRNLFITIATSFLGATGLVFSISCLSSYKPFDGFGAIENILDIIMTSYLNKILIIFSLTLIFISIQYRRRNKEEAKCEEITN